MQDEELIGKCGLYCGACIIFIAQGNEKARSKLAESFKCDPDQIRCKGCGALDGESWGKDCKIVACIEENGYESCYDCDKFHKDECEIFKKVHERYLDRADFDLRVSLGRRADFGVEKWLEECREIFTCDNCGEGIIMGSHTCWKCGAEI